MSNGTTVIVGSARVATGVRAADARSAGVGPAAVAGLLIALAAVYLYASVSWRHAILFLVGAGAGLVRYHAAFGFTSSWRALVTSGRGDGLRAPRLRRAHRLRLQHRRVLQRHRVRQSPRLAVDRRRLRRDVRRRQAPSVLRAVERDGNQPPK
jgi:hypothetical protein